MQGWLIISIIGFMAMLVSFSIDMWIAGSHPSSAIQRELYAAGFLILFGGLISFVFPPLGFLMIVVSLIMNVVLASNEKEASNHNALIAAGIMSVLGIVLAASGLFYKAATIASRVAADSPELFEQIGGPSGKQLAEALQKAQLVKLLGEFPVVPV